jgi:cell wall-associated NlpC family hydrolase
MALPRAKDFLAKAFALEGTPYIWGGKNHQGIDCSGLVTVSLHEAGGPDWTQTHGAANLWEALPKVEEQELVRGHLVFFGNERGHIYHVGIYLDAKETLEAAHGDHTCTNLEEAKRRDQGRGARVCRRNWRRASLKGFRALPLDYTP